VTKETRTPTPTENTDATSTASSQEQHVRRVLEAARQTVKPVIKRELEAEVANEDVVNLRFKATFNDINH